MKTTIKFLASGLMILALTITSCSQDSVTGDIGPIGPKGDQGIQGEKGEPGTNGEDGEDGNAIVLASDWFPLTFEKTLVSGLAHFNSDKAVPEITAEIVEGGTVLVYGRLNGYTDRVWPRDKVAQFPITLMYNSLGNTQINIYKALISEGNIQFNITENYDIHDGQGPANRFRYVIVPSNMTSGKSPRPDFKKMSYDEVIDYLGLDY